jgi:hypothetical protein
MRSRTIRLFVGILAVLALAALYHHHFLEARSRAASPGRPIVFYDESGAPSEKTPALPKAAVRQIIGMVAAQTRDPVWLIRVTPADTYVAYVVPDETTSRIRVGRAYGPRKSKEQEQIGIGSLWQYVQVSLPERSFTKKLLRPTIADLPFAWPMVVDPNSGKNRPMPREEVANIVDFVRRQSSSSPIYRTLWNTRELPFLGVTREDGNVHVDLGFMHDVLWGNGVRIEIRCTPTGYQILDWSDWIS